MPIETADTLIAADTTAHSAETPMMPWDTALCHEAEAPWSGAESSRMTAGTIPYLKGMTPQERSTLPGYDSGVICLLILVFVLLSTNFSHYSTYIKNFTQDLWSVRRRENVFDVKTFSETRVQLSMALLVCLCEGIILYSVSTGAALWASIGIFPAILLLSAAAGLYYLLQTWSYRLTGYVFSDKVTSRLWIKGFNASQSFLGLSLTIPSLLLLFNPGLTAIMVGISVFLYFTARIIFICKGFRLFYDKFSSLSYFILYLCTLEIVPLILLFRVYFFIAKLQPL